VIAALLMTSSCSTNTMTPYVPAHCHGQAQPFKSYVLEYKDVPGFILDVINTSLNGALERQGLTAAAETQADVKVLSTLEVIEHSSSRPTASEPVVGGDAFGVPAGASEHEIMGETVAPNELHRFVTHLTIDVIDQRTNQLIWTGAIDRAHAIQGGETFHDERAVLQISQAFDQMFVGLTTPCE